MESHLREDTMPCVYTDEEFAEVVRRSEASGNASEEKVKAFFAKWGISFVAVGTAMTKK